ncbi:Tetratricopeptide repeat protein [compost metagenome]
MKAEEYLRKAYRSIYENDFEQALQWFEHALVAEPDNGDIHYRYSITCARSNRLEKAITHARLASALAPSHEEYKIHYDRLQSKELTLMAKKLVEDNSGNDDRKADLSAIQSAVRLLKRASLLDPLSVETQVWLALAYIEQRKFKYALTAVREAAALPQDDGVAKELLELERRIIKYMDQSPS